MASYLELCQMVARESGTIAGSLPTVTAGQTGRLLKVVEWVPIAWTRIQNAQANWRWMRAEFSSTAVTSGTQRYTGASFGLSRHADWITEPDTMTIYLTATGVTDESVLNHLDYARYRAMFERNVQPTGKPTYFAVSPIGELCLGPEPDDAYTIRGEYRKTPQTLALDADVPEMPLRFHDLIGWFALTLLAEHDEGEFHTITSTRRYRDGMDDLIRDQLPHLRWSDALA